MESTLLLRLPANQYQTVGWQRFSYVDGKEVSESGSLGLNQLSNLAEQSRECRVIVLVPGELVNITTLVVPGRINQAVIKSLPYRLEEDLGCDVDSVHIAMLGKNADQLYLAVVDRALMQQWSDWLASAAIVSRQWLPETLALPWRDGQCVVASRSRKDCALVRHGAWEVGACDQEWLSVYLQSLTETCDQSLETVQLDLNEAGSVMVAEVRRQKANLLQGEWEPKSAAKSSSWKNWRLSMALVAMVSSVWLGGTLWNTHQLQQQAGEYQSRSVAVFKEIFPKKRVVRLLPQLKRELASMKQNQDTEQGLLDYLNRLAPVMEKYSDIKPVEFSYENSRKQLKIVAEASSMGTFSRLRDQVSAFSEVRLESLEQNGAKVTGVLVFTGKG